MYREMFCCRVMCDIDFKKSLICKARELSKGGSKFSTSLVSVNNFLQHLLLQQDHWNCFEPSKQD